MFSTFAKTRDLGRALSERTRRGANSRDVVHRGRPGLVCHWQPDRTTGKLLCSWEIDAGSADSSAELANEWQADQLFVLIAFQTRGLVMRTA